MADTLISEFERVVAILRHGEAMAALAFEKTPALAFGITVMLAFLPLAVFGLAIGRMRTAHFSPRSSHESVVRTRTPGATQTGEAPRWPADAWIEIVGGSIVWIGRRMVRIGRDADNEISIPAGTVHRHHAVIHHTEDADFMIRDLSSAEGNGVVVNGRRVGAARLRHGDTVVLGEAVLKFHLRPA